MMIVTIILKFIKQFIKIICFCFHKDAIFICPDYKSIFIIQTEHINISHYYF